MSNNIYKLHNIELKPGMVLITKDESQYIVFPGYNEELCLIEHGYSNWNTLPWEEVTDNVIKIQESVGDTSISDGKTLWQIKPIEITMNEIAKKFHIPVEYIKVKK